MSTSHPRMTQIDSLRGIVVILAMLDHVKVQFVPDVHVLVPLTRMATPCFIILFGIMIEVAYLSKHRAGVGLDKIKTRMISRALTCWSLACLLTIAAIASGNLTFEAGLRSVGALGLGRFNEIFLIYTALFILLISFLPMIVRFGSVPVLALAIVGWALHPVLNQHLSESPFWLSFIFGNGVGYGPSIIPSLTFLAFGMAVGEFITKRRSSTLAWMLFAAAVIVFSFELSHGLLEAGRRFLAHRWMNHPGYYAVGMIGFAGLFLSVVVASRLALFHKQLDFLAVIGSQTLFVYAAGNLALNALPMISMDRLTGIVIALGFMVLLLGLAYAGPQRRNRLAVGLPAHFNALYGQLNTTIAKALLNLSLQAGHATTKPGEAFSPALKRRSTADGPD